MRKFGIITLLAAVVICLAHKAIGQEPTKFTLKGDIGYLLERYDKGSVIESVALRVYPNMQTISNGGNTISHYGVFDGVPTVAELVVDITVPTGSGSAAVVFVLEPGELVFDGGIVPRGGKLNNAIREIAEKLPKMKRAEAYDAVKKFVLVEENAPASVILLQMAAGYLGSGNTLQIIQAAPDAVKNHKAIKSMVTPLKNEAMLEANQLATQSGKKFKDFSVIYKGNMYSLSDYVGKGKYVLVDFWASWCGPCKAEIPNLINIHNKYSGNDFEVLGVAVYDKASDTEAAISKMGMTYPQIIGAGKEVAAMYGINGIPHIILFAPDGTILYRGLRGAQIEETVKKVLKK